MATALQHMRPAPPLSRKAIEDTIEALVTLLDVVDGDPDEEEDDDDSAVDDRPCDEPYQDLEPEMGL